MKHLFEALLNQAAFCRSLWQICVEKSNSKSGANVLYYNDWILPKFDKIAINITFTVAWPNLVGEIQSFQ